MDNKGNFKAKAAALSIAVAVALSSAFVGCSNRNPEDDEDDESYYNNANYGSGGTYFYSSGSSFRGGSWSDASTIKGSSLSKSGYSSARGGSLGG